MANVTPTWPTTSVHDRRRDGTVVVEVDPDRFGDRDREHLEPIAISDHRRHRSISVDTDDDEAITREGNRESLGDGIA